MIDTLRVAEVFSPAIQGEGPYAGRACGFVRLMGCNLSCSWCDTKQTWDPALFDLPSETTLMTAREIAKAVHGVSLVILTGGEPLLQQDSVAWAQLLWMLPAQAVRFQVETNGTIAPNKVTRERVSTFVVSPKLSNAGEHRGHQDPSISPAWARDDDLDAHLKVVCENAADVDQAVKLADALGWNPERVWVMPQGRSPAWLESTWPVVAEAARQYGINASHRLHVLAWGDVRGR